MSEIRLNNDPGGAGQTATDSGGSNTHAEQNPVANEPYSTFKSFNDYELFVLAQYRRDLVCPKCNIVQEMSNAGKAGNVNQGGFRTIQLKCSGCQDKFRQRALLVNSNLDNETTIYDAMLRKFIEAGQLVATQNKQPLAALRKKSNTGIKKRRPVKTANKTPPSSWRFFQPTAPTSTVDNDTTVNPDREEMPVEIEMDPEIPPVPIPQQTEVFPVQNTVESEPNTEFEDFLPPANETPEQELLRLRRLEVEYRKLTKAFADLKNTTIRTTNDLQAFQQETRLQFQQLEKLIQTGGMNNLNNVQAGGEKGNNVIQSVATSAPIKPTRTMPKISRGPANSYAHAAAIRPAVVPEDKKKTIDRAKAQIQRAFTSKKPPADFSRLHIRIDNNILKLAHDGQSRARICREVTKFLGIEEKVTLSSTIGNPIIELYIPKNEMQATIDIIRNQDDSRYEIIQNMDVFAPPVHNRVADEESVRERNRRAVRRNANLYRRARFVKLRKDVMAVLSDESLRLVQQCIIEQELQFNPLKEGFEYVFAEDNGLLVVLGRPTQC